MTFAALIVVSKPAAEEMGGLRLAFIEMVVGAVVVVPAAVVSDWSGPSDRFLWLGALAVVHTALAMALYFRSLAVVPATDVGTLGYLEPALTVLAAWLFLSERPTIAMVGGGALILGAGTLVAARSNVARTEATAPIRPRRSIVFLGEDILPLMVLAIAGAMVVGNVMAMVHPPEQAKEGELASAPRARTITFIVVGTIAASGPWRAWSRDDGSSMTSERIAAQLAFILELDGAKHVMRQNDVADRSRRENDAEHMWHLAVMTLVLAEHAQSRSTY